MKNFKLELFNFKQKLTLDDSDVERIIEGHIQGCDNFSEKEIYNSLNSKLTRYIFDGEVKSLLEGLKSEIDQNTLTANLKDLYKKVERKNHSMIYRQPLNTILQIITKDNDDAKMESILNELSLHDWIPEVKHFMMEFKKSPIEIQNYKNAGKAEKVYTLVEKVNDGFIAYIGNRWFFLGESEVKLSMPDSHIEDAEKIKTIRILEEAIKRATISENMISFKIDENLVIGVSTKDGKLYLNDQKTDESSNLENIFSSPIVPYLKKDYYLIIKTINENISNFVELDVVLKNYSQVNPFLNIYAFNYKDKMYLYNVDERVGSSLFEYESVNNLISDVQKSVDYDITYFFENKLSKEMKHFKALEDKEMKLNAKIKETNEAIELLQAEAELLKEDENLQAAFDTLISVKESLSQEVLLVINDKKSAKKLIINK